MRIVDVLARPSDTVPRADLTASAGAREGVLLAGVAAGGVVIIPMLQDAFQGVPCPFWRPFCATFSSSKKG